MLESGQLKYVKNIISFDAYEEEIQKRLQDLRGKGRQLKLYTCGEILKKGQEINANFKGVDGTVKSNPYLERRNLPIFDFVYQISYSSGTTGVPKGSMITQISSAVSQEAKVKGTLSMRKIPSCLMCRFLTFRSKSLLLTA
jgi:long-subunit acyl-CoA synthetase (AMP-forming)